MSYDPRRGRTVLLAAGWPGPRTWEWDGITWLETTSAAPASTIVRRPTFLYSDVARGCVLLPGASGTPGFMAWTTALRSSAHPAAWEGYGQGCPGTLGVPELGIVNEALPWLGDAFAVRLVRTGATLGALVLGTSATTWNGTPLPLALGPIMPGCSLWASADVIVPLTMVQGAGTHALALPLQPALVGLSLHSQGIVDDPSANPAGLVVSAGGRALLGLR